MKSFLVRCSTKLFPVQRHEWPKALILLSVATMLGMGFSMSRAASEALFLTRVGVEFLPSLLLVNPILVLLSTTVYSAYADRIANDRLLMYTALAPMVLIVVLRLLIALEADWVYFLLYAFVLSYATVLTTSWVVYLSGHYDVQEAKRLVPFVSSGILLGSMIGGVGVALCVPLLGAANILWLWLGSLGAAALVVQGVRHLFTPLEAQSRKGQQATPRPGLRQNLTEGIAFSRTSSLFMTTAVVSIITMMALQLIDFEYSKILSRAFPESGQLTAFLGVFDGLTTGGALLLQWFVTPFCIRRFGVQGTNLLFPAVLTVAFGGLILAPALPSAMFARFSRASLMPSLRGATRTLILNAVPRKMAARVRSFNTGIVMPVGQGAGALALLILKGLDVPLFFPMLGLLAAAVCIVLSLRQNKAYGEALLDLLREDKIHLLDLEDDEIRQLDAAAVAAISERLTSEQTEIAQAASPLAGESHQFMQAIASAQEETTLAAIELLRAIGNTHAFEALRQHLPYASPRLTATALQALAAMGGKGAADTLFPYLDDPHPRVRKAALLGLQQLGATALQQRVASLLTDTEVEVQATALALVLAEPGHPLSAQAQRLWETLLSSPEKAAQMAALAVIPTIPGAAASGYAYQALRQSDADLRHEALRVLRHLAVDRRMTDLDAALLEALRADDAETRELALHVLTAVGTDAALEHVLALLDDDQPHVREALVQALKPLGRRTVAPLLRRLHSPRGSLTAKEGALLVLSHLHGVQPDQLAPFWEDALRNVYTYKLMLGALARQTPLAADAFLEAALRNAYDQTLSLLLQLVGIWSSPETARLVASGLRDVDRHQRAHALEAIESLSERRFTRLFLPILETTGNDAEGWQEVAKRQWDMSDPELSTVLDTCRQSTDKWLVIGALVSAQARAVGRDGAWRAHGMQIAASTPDADVRHTARRLLGLETNAPLQRLALTEAILFLKRVPLYSSLSLDQLRTITAHLSEREVQVGEEIFHQGDRSREFYLIVSGSVQIRQQRGDTVQTLATLAAGDFFGDMAILDDRPRSASAVATASGILLMLSADRFRQVILQEPAISFEIFRELSARLRRFDQEPVAAAP